MQLAVTVLLCLLFQQVAVAAYVCTLPAMPAETAAMVEACAETGMPAAEEAPALCANHCTPKLAVVAADHATPPAPAALALPPVEFPALAVMANARPSCQRQVAVHRSDPPPRLRYCRLLI